MKSSSIDDFIRPNKILCEIIGMMPISVKDLSMPRRYFVYFRIVFAVVSINTIFVPQILDIAVNWGDIEILTGVGCITTTLGQLLFKIVYLLWNRDTAIRMYYLVEDLWKVSDEPEDKKIIEKYAYYAKMFTIFFIVSAFSNNISFTAASILNLIEMRRNHNNETDYINGLPFEVWYGPNPLSWTKFQLVFGPQLIASVMCAVGVVGLDGCIMTLILHVCSQFKLIRCWFRRIGAAIHNKMMSKDNSIDQSFNTKIRRDIIKCIEHHQRMLLIAEEVGGLLNPVIFVQFLMSGVEICLSGVAITTPGVSTGDFMKFACHLLSLIIELHFWCWPGEVLIRESVGVGEAVYFDTMWYELPNELRMDMCLVIARSQKQCSITAMKFQIMSLSTIGKVFNTAASYIALLRQMQMKDNLPKDVEYV